MVRELAQALPYIIVGLFILALLLFLVSLQQLRRGRTGSYWRLRREAGQRGGQLFLISLALFVLAIAIAIFSGLGDLAYQRLRQALESNNPDIVHGVALSSATVSAPASPTPTTTKTPSPTLTRTPQPNTATPSSTPLPTSTSTPSTTYTPTVTLTPSATFEVTLAVTLPTSAVQVASTAGVDITSAALDVASDGTGVNPGNSFAAGAKRLYFFIQFHDMTPGVTLTRVLYREGIPVQAQTSLWSMDAAGSSYFFFGSEAGYPVGAYEIKLFAGQTLLSTFAFRLQ